MGKLTHEQRDGHDDSYAHVYTHAYKQTIYTSTTLKFNMCNLCEETEAKLKVGHQTDRQKAAKQ